MTLSIDPGRDLLWFAMCLLRGRPLHLGGSERVAVAGAWRRPRRVRAVGSGRGQETVHLVGLAATDLLEGDGTGRVPECVPPWTLKAVLGSDGEDCKQQLGRHVGDGQGWDVQEREVFVEATYVTFEEACRRVAGREYEVGREYRRELFETALHHIVFVWEDAERRRRTHAHATAAAAAAGRRVHHA